MSFEHYIVKASLNANVNVVWDNSSDPTGERIVYETANQESAEAVTAVLRKFPQVFVNVTLIGVGPRAEEEGDTFLTCAMPPWA